MSSRLKSFGFGSKRKSNVNLPTSSGSGTSVALPSQSPNGSTSVANTPPPANSSQTSLTPMNQPGLGRPPSYQYSNVAGRPQSPMPPPSGQQVASHHPPPIDTSRGFVGANPQMAQQPPGYGGAGYGQAMQPHPQQMGQYGLHMRPAEVEGGNRSKAQLIVGIDFVSTCYKPDQSDCMLTSKGDHLFRRGIRLRDKHRSKGRHNNGMAWCRQPNEAKGMTMGRSRLN